MYVCMCLCVYIYIYIYICIYILKKIEPTVNYITPLLLCDCT